MEQCMGTKGDRAHALELEKKNPLDSTDFIRYKSTEPCNRKSLQPIKSNGNSL
jgi:hypothetical protein